MCGPDFKPRSSSNIQPRGDFWRGKRVTITGHSGFKGGWLTLWLNLLGARVTGISLPPVGAPNLFTLASIQDLCTVSEICDIRNTTALAPILRASDPEILFHLAAQPLVRASYREPLDTFSTNVLGTANILEALRTTENIRIALIITTDKVYQNREWPWPYREIDRLGGHDPYSASKAASEFVISSYRESFLRGQGVAVASARAGNVIGGGDWSEDRLIPDAVRAWQAEATLAIRSPHAIRPWQHVLDPLAGYMLAAEELWAQPELAGAFNFGPDSRDAATVRDVVDLAKHAYGRGEVRYEEDTEGLREANLLALDVAKARTLLGYRPRWGLPEAITRTMEWYAAQYDGADPLTLCKEDIASYEDRG